MDDLVNRHVRLQFKDPDPHMGGGFTLPAHPVDGTVAGTYTGPHGEPYYYVRLEQPLELEPTARTVRERGGKERRVGWLSKFMKGRKRETNVVGVSGTSTNRATRVVEGVIPKGTTILYGQSLTDEPLIYVEDPSVVRVDDEGNVRRSLAQELLASRRASAATAHLIFRDHLQSKVGLLEVQAEMRKPLTERTYVYIGYAEIELK